jgi:hypothetical protein
MVHWYTGFSAAGILDGDGEEERSEALLSVEWAGRLTGDLLGEGRGWGLDKGEVADSESLASCFTCTTSARIQREAEINFRFKASI